MRGEHPRVEMSFTQMGLVIARHAQKTNHRLACSVSWLLSCGFHLWRKGDAGSAANQMVKTNRQGDGRSPKIPGRNRHPAGCKIVEGHRDAEETRRNQAGKLSWHRTSCDLQARIGETFRRLAVYLSYASSHARDNLKLMRWHTLNQIGRASCRDRRSI